MLNAMTELAKLAETYHLEGKLYQDTYLGIVYEIMGDSRLRKFLKKNIDLFPSGQDEWNKIQTFLERERKNLQNFIVSEKSMQPILCSDIAYSEKPGNLGKTITLRVVTRKNLAMLLAATRRGQFAKFVVKRTTKPTSRLIVELARLVI